MSEKAIIQNVSVREHKWRKCNVVANELNNELHNSKHNFNDEDKQHVFKRFLDKEDVINLFPKFQPNSKATKQKLALCDSVRIVYAHFVSDKSRDNMHYRSAFLSLVVSTKTSPFAPLIYRTINK